MMNRYAYYRAFWLIVGFIWMVMSTINSSQGDRNETWIFGALAVFALGIHSILVALNK